ncbi:hypothetical protein AAZX31_07G205000 [Glycine max]
MCVRMGILGATILDCPCYCRSVISCMSFSWGNVSPGCLWCGICCLGCTLFGISLVSESLLFHHPDACVVVFSEMVELDFFKESFVKDGYKVAVAILRYKVAVATPMLDELLKDMPAHIFATVWFEWKKTGFCSTHYSELIHLAALYKYGGIYLDSDIIVLKPINFFY